MTSINSKIEIIVFVIEEGSPNAFSDKFVTKLGNKSSDSPNVVTNLVMNFVNYQTSASKCSNCWFGPIKTKVDQFVIEMVAKFGEMLKWSHNFSSDLSPNWSLNV